jgi:hypothetical protein
MHRGFPPASVGDADASLREQVRDVLVGEDDLVDGVLAALQIERGDEVVQVRRKEDLWEGMSADGHGREAACHKGSF